MLKVESLGTNRTQVTIDHKVILVSYSTPVAALCLIDGKWKAFRTSTFHSVTTSKHITMWLKDNHRNLVAIEKDQSFFDNLLNCGGDNS